MRGNSEPLTVALRAVLAGNLIEDAPRAASYSMRLSDDPNIFHTLYQGSCAVVSSPDARRVLTALVRHLDGHAGPPDGLVPVEATAVVRGGQAMLVPRLLDTGLRSHTRRLEQHGARLVDTSAPFLDLERHELVVEPRLTVDVGGLERAARLAPAPRRPDPAVAEGRYPVTRWLFPAAPEAVGRYSRATASCRAALLVRGGLQTVAGAPLERLAGFFRTVEAEGIDLRTEPDLLALLTR